MAAILTPRQFSQRADLYHQLGQLAAAGVGLINAVEMLARNPPARSFRAPLRQIVSELAQGCTFTEAVQRCGHWVSSFDLALLQAGEQSGRLDAVFRILSDHYTDRAQLTRQMISDLLYPVFVFHLAVFLFPFISFFQTGNWVMFGLKTFGLLIPLYLIIFLIIYALQGRHGFLWRSLVESILRPIPVLGAARQYLALSRLAAALEALLNAGVTIIEAWDLAAAASGSPALARAVAEWRPRVVAGKTPAEEVSACRNFPEMFANLYYTGEVSGQLDDSLRRLSKYYQEEGRRKLHNVAKWGPQFFYLGVAAMVGFKVIAFYTDYFNSVGKVMDGFSGKGP
jgi:type II secretory pathway component PulF